MYLQFFGLTEHPFRVTPDSRYLYLGQAHARAMAYMEYTVWNRDSFVVITGEIGSGKTTLIQKLLSQLDESVVVAKIYQTQLDELEFLQAFLLELGLEPFNASKVQLLNMLNMFFIEQYAAGRRVVLIVDEAQNLSRRVLEEVRLLAGLETQQGKILNIILVGQPELNDMLNSPGMEQLVQRIRLRFHLKALTEEETGEYIRHRLRVAGSEQEDLFPEDTLGLIYEYTGGIPRLINTLCDTVLICAFADEQQDITVDMIHTAIGELQWVPYAQRVQQNRPPEALSQATPLLNQNLSLQMESLYHNFSSEVTKLEERLKRLADRLGK